MSVLFSVILCVAGLVTDRQTNRQTRDDSISSHDNNLQKDISGFVPINLLDVLCAMCERMSHKLLVQVFIVVVV